MKTAVITNQTHLEWTRITRSVETRAQLHNVHAAGSDEGKPALVHIAEIHTKISLQDYLNDATAFSKSHENRLEHQQRKTRDHSPAREDYRRPKSQGEILSSTLPLKEGPH